MAGSAGNAGETRSLSQAAIEAAGDVAYEWDLASGRITWAGAIASLFGEVKPPAAAITFESMIHADDRANRARQLALHHASEHAFDWEYRVRPGRLPEIWVHDRGRISRDAHGAPVRICGMLRAVTERKRREARLENLVNHDGLTGLFNRQRLSEALANSLAYAQRYGVEGAYLEVGIDKLNLVNSVFGYEAADSIIAAVAERLNANLRTSDAIGRTGGDRFGIVLGKCPRQSLAAAAEKFLHVIGETPIETLRGPVDVTISIGVVAFPGSARTADEIMVRAAGALVDAKQAGRNCMAVFEPTEEQQRVHKRSLDIVRRVRAALAEDRLILAFQPVVDARSRKAVHYEALVRMREDDGRIVPAAHFIPPVERMGMIKSVDRRALDLALEQLRGCSWLRLAVNFSGLSTADTVWQQDTLAFLSAEPRSITERLIVEITETAALHEIDGSARFIASLRDLGCHVALDDFGAGQTTLRHIRSLAVDSVKIDGAFVRDVATNLDNQLFVRTLLGLAESFGLDTVAECVETAEDADLLTRQSVRYLQGFYFGRPVIGAPWLDTPTQVIQLQAVPPNVGAVR